MPPLPHPADELVDLAWSLPPRSAAAKPDDMSRGHSGQVRLVAILALAIISSCSRSTPAGFWTSYKPELIANRRSDQGPWGGTRWVQWLGAKPGTFAPVDVVRFAESKGWACQKPLGYIHLDAKGTRMAYHLWGEI
jgi:hypothetical protein